MHSFNNLLKDYQIILMPKLLIKIFEVDIVGFTFLTFLLSLNLNN